MRFHDISHNKILVTGSARSGTHICATMIAYDTGLCLVPEQSFKAKDLDLFWLIYWRQERFVTPCNGMRHYIRDLGQWDDTLIIVMERPADEILASARRINGSMAHMEYPYTYIKEQYEIIYEQLPHVVNYRCIKYADLSDHPLWISKGDRVDFDDRQVHRNKNIHELVRVCQAKKDWPSWE